LFFRRTKVLKQLELIDSLTGKKILTLENGMSVTMSDIPGMSIPSFNVRAIVEGKGAAVVKFELDGKAANAEKTDPFALCGKKGPVYNKCLELGIGSHNVKATLHRCRNGRCNASGSLDVSFAIAAATPSPKTAPVVTPIVAPVYSPIVAPVAPVLTPVIPPTSSPMASPAVPIVVPVVAPVAPPIVAPAVLVIPAFVDPSFSDSCFASICIGTGL
jgi:hypothetical protein